MLILLRATRAKGRVWVGLIGELQPGPNFIQAGAAQARDDKLDRISGVDLQPGFAAFRLSLGPVSFGRHQEVVLFHQGGKPACRPPKALHGISAKPAPGDSLKTGAAV